MGRLILDIKGIRGLGSGWDRAYVAEKVCVLETLLKSFNSHAILDVGSSCGIGKNLSFGLEDFPMRSDSSYTHLDIERSMMLKSKSSHRDSDFLLADASNLPLRDEMFDLVFASEILEHLVDSEKGLDEWCRVLEPKGYMLITTPNTSMSWKRVYLRFFEKHEVSGGHVSEYDVRNLCESLQKRSMKVLTILGFNLVFVGPVRLFIVYLRRLLDIISDDLSVKLNRVMCRLGNSYPLFSDSVLVLCSKNQSNCSEPKE